MNTASRRGWFLVGLSLMAALLAGCSEPPAVSSLQQTLGGEPDPGFARATQPRPFSFPEDHGAHPDYQTEWWYFTGHLAADSRAQSDPAQFGYQLTFFRQALVPDGPTDANDWSASQLYLAHFAISDLQGQRFYQAQRLTRGSAGLASAALNQMAVEVEDWQVRWQGDQIELSAASGQIGLALTLTPQSAVVPHGDRGLSRKGPGPGNASYYYSIPELASSGDLRVGGQSYRVSGSSWLDREWSTSVLTEGQAGWDWFSLNLGSGGYLMLFQLRDSEGNPDAFSAGTLVDGQQVIALGPKDFTLQPGRTWRSPHSGANYPLSWQISLPDRGLELTVMPLLEDQEINQNFRYWEGAISAEGQWRSQKITAQGYLEMTGYDGKR